MPQQVMNEEANSVRDNTKMSAVANFLIDPAYTIKL